MVIGIQIAAIYLGAFDVDKLANFDTRLTKPQKQQKSAYWYNPPINREKWGTKKPDEKFDWGDDYTEPTEDNRVKRAPNVIGAGAKKCGTIAFSTFLALNKQVLMATLRCSSLINYES